MSDTPTPEESSAVETKGDAMSDITRWKVSGPATRLQPDADGPWVALVDYYRVIDRLIAERDAAQAEVERLRADRDDLRKERDDRYWAGIAAANRVPR